MPKSLDYFLFRGTTQPRFMVKGGQKYRVSPRRGPGRFAGPESARSHIAPVPIRSRRQLQVTNLLSLLFDPVADTSLTGLSI